MGLLNFMPLPTFRIDRQLNVLEYSESAALRFGKQLQLNAIVDEGSRKKLARLREQSTTLEMALHTAAAKLELFLVSVQWNENEALVQCVEMDKKLARLEQMVRQQQMRLADADFQLVEKKEEAEQALIKMKERSAPLIALNHETALIPVFGDLDYALMAQTKNRLARQFHKGDYRRLYIDFTAVDAITLEGIEQFTQLVNTLLLLDAEIEIVGVKPRHAPFLKDYQHAGITFSSAIEVNSKSLNSE